MKLGICTIQRNRGKWIKEWVAFHHVVGITHFYIYLHKCTDNSKEIVTELQKSFNIQCFEVSEDTVRPQLVAYEHAYQTFGHEIDWMSFIDGDEFLYPSSANTLVDALQELRFPIQSARQEHRQRRPRPSLRQRWERPSFQNDSWHCG